MNYAWPSVFGCCKQYPGASAEHIVPGNSVQVGVEAKRLQGSQIVLIAIVQPLLETAERFPAPGGFLLRSRCTEHQNYSVTAHPERRLGYTSRIKLVPVPNAAMPAKA